MKTLTRDEVLQILLLTLIEQAGVHFANEWQVDGDWGKESTVVIENGITALTEAYEKPRDHFQQITKIDFVGGWQIVVGHARYALRYYPNQLLPMIQRRVEDDESIMPWHRVAVNAAIGFLTTQWNQFEAGELKLSLPLE